MFVRNKTTEDSKWDYSTWEINCGRQNAPYFCNTKLKMAAVFPAGQVYLTFPQATCLVLTR